MVLSVTPRQENPLLKAQLPTTLLATGIALTAIGLVVMALGLLPGSGIGIAGIALGAGTVAVGLVLSTVCLVSLLSKKCIGKSRLLNQNASSDDRILIEANFILNHKKIIAWKPNDKTSDSLDSTTSRPCGYFVAFDGSQVPVFGLEKNLTANPIMQHCQFCEPRIDSRHDDHSTHPYTLFIWKAEAGSRCFRYDIVIGEWENPTSISNT